MTKQNQTEAIAKFLGVTVDTMSGVLHLGDEPLRTPHSAGYVYRRNPEEFINWLNSDGGTVSMIEKLRRYSAKARECLREAIKATTLNAALRKAILEILDEKDLKTIQCLADNGLKSAYKKLDAKYADQLAGNVKLIKEIAELKSENKKWKTLHEPAYRKNVRDLREANATLKAQVEELENIILVTGAVIRDPRDIDGENL